MGMLVIRQTTLYECCFVVADDDYPFSFEERQILWAKMLYENSGFE